MPKQTKKKVDSISLLLATTTTSSSLLENLPDEVLLHIFEYMKVEARPNLVRSCHRFYALKSSIYKEQVRSECGQKIYLCNCPYCKKLMRVPFVSVISKRKDRPKNLVRQWYQNKIYCSTDCVMKEHIRTA